MINRGIIGKYKFNIIILNGVANAVPFFVFEGDGYCGLNFIF